MFQLSKEEWNSLRSQIVTLEKEPLANKQIDKSLRSQFVTLEKGRGNYPKYLPYAFTEHGVTMLANVLKSKKARQTSVAVVRAFIALKKFANKNAAILHLVKELKDRIDEHDVQLGSIYNAIENMLDEKEEENVKKINWEERERIGFKK